MNKYEHERWHREKELSEGPGCLPFVFGLVLVGLVLWVWGSIVNDIAQSTDCRIYHLEHGVETRYEQEQHSFFDSLMLPSCEVLTEDGWISVSEHRESRE